LPPATWAFFILFIPSILDLKEKAKEFCWVGNERYILIALKKLLDYGRIT
jgi:hypothetical protein